MGELTAHDWLHESPGRQDSASPDPAKCATCVPHRQPRCREKKVTIIHHHEKLHFSMSTKACWQLDLLTKPFSSTMATKRTHEDVDVDDVGHDSPNQGGPSAKKPRFNGTGKKHKAKEGSIEHAKKRSRTIERLFQRNSDLPSEVRRDLETELASLKYNIEKKSFQKRRSAMISKYHMVRFFGKALSSLRATKQLMMRRAEEGIEAGKAAAKEHSED